MEGIQVVFLTSLALFRMQEAALMATTGAIRTAVGRGLTPPLEPFKMVEILRNGSAMCADPDLLIRVRTATLLSR